MRKVSIRRPGSPGLMKGVLLPLAGCAAVTGAGFVLREVLLPENQVLVFLLFVVTVTVKLGRMAGFVATLASVLLYDLFLVPPYLSFDVHDAQHLLTFALILVVAQITSHFVEGIRMQHRMAMEREQQANALREMSVALAGATDMISVCQVGAQYMRRIFNGTSKVFVAGDAGKLVLAGQAGRELPLPFAMAKIAAALMGGASSRQELPVYSAGVYYFALHTPGGAAGVLVLVPENGTERLTMTAERLAQVATQQLAMTIERVRLTEAANESHLEIKAERFRNSLLNSVSHDLRTPLAALNGLAGQLLARADGVDEVPQAIQRVAQRLENMVGNLLDLARFSQGRTHLRQDWHVIDEVIGSAIAQVREHGGKLRYLSAVQGGPVLVSFDAVLIERVLCNLLENAERHAADAAQVRVSATRRRGWLVVMVSDDGMGISKMAASTLAGLGKDDTRPGLGLSICRAIIDAHGGQFRIGRRRGGGTRAAFGIPISEAPALETDE